MPVPAIVAAAATSKLSGKAQSIVSGWFGGGARDDARKRRLKIYQDGVHIGYSVTAARYMYGQATQNVNEHEQDWYAQAIKDEERDRPEVMAAGRQLGGLFDPDDKEINGAGIIANEMAKRVGDAADHLQNAGASFVQDFGAGLTTAATQKLAPDGSPLKNAITIPTSMRTLLIIGVVLVVAFVLVWRRK